MAVIKFHHYSKTLSSVMDCNVIIPNTYMEGMLVKDNKKEPLKVVWLCHGGSGDENEWLYHTDLCGIADRYNLAAVVVNANDSCFVDMPFGLNYGTYIGEELVEIVRNTFKFFSHNREDNYISGLSNGGYGCFYIGLQHPDTFGAIGAFSAGDKADATPKPFKEGEMNPRVRMFGAVDIHNTDFSIKHLARKLAASEQVKPKIYHACGGLDPWLDMNLKVKECFESLDCKEYQYTYHQIDKYGHEWPFWEEELNNFLQWLNN